MNLGRLSRPELAEWVASLPPSYVVGMLLVGDRLSCIDEAVACEVENQIIGVATIAPRGEMSSGVPTIVALYILSAFRGKGYGKSLMEAAVRRCVERGFSRVRVDILSAYAKRIIESLPEDLKSVLEVHDLGNPLDYFESLE